VYVQVQVSVLPDKGRLRHERDSGPVNLSVAGPCDSCQTRTAARRPSQRCAGKTGAWCTRNVAFYCCCCCWSCGCGEDHRERGAAQLLAGSVGTSRSSRRRHGQEEWLSTVNAEERGHSGQQQRAGAARYGSFKLLGCLARTCRAG
jgi:hypothetical protein